MDRIERDLRELQLKIYIQSRSVDEWNQLYLRRVVLIFINIVAIGFSTWLIIKTNTNSKNLIDWFERLEDRFRAQWIKDVTHQVGILAPTLVLTIMNAVIVPIIKKIVELEKWDFNFQIVN